MLPKIIPTILTKSEEDLKRRIKTLEDLVDRVQIDVVDGVFAPNQTLSLEAISQIETSLSLDIHLMVDEPSGWIDKCLQIMSRRVIGQIEKMADQEEFVTEVVQVGMEAGLAVDLVTRIKTLSHQALSSVDLVLLLAVRAGFGGKIKGQRKFSF
jgi:ribulose-phosphate 3-epimerase